MLLGLTTAGTPAAMQLSGTSRMTTALAPMITLLPILMGPKTFAPDADIDVIADHGRAGLIDSLQPDDHPIADAAIVAELGISADHNPTEVIDDEIAADFHLAGQLDSGDDLREFEPDFVDQRKEFAQQRGPNPVAPAPKAINDQRPKSLCAPIAAMRAQILTDVVKHRRSRGRARRHEGCILGY